MSERFPDVSVLGRAAGFELGFRQLDKGDPTVPATLLIGTNVTLAHMRFGRRFHQLGMPPAGKLIAQLREMAAEGQGISPDQVDMTNINAFYVLEAAYIDATLDEINKEYGSLNRYVREGLGLGDAEVQQLRDALLD